MPAIYESADILNEDALYESEMEKCKSVNDNSLKKISNFLRKRGFDYESINKVLRKIKNDYEE